MTESELADKLYEIGHGGGYQFTDFDKLARYVRIMILKARINELNYTFESTEIYKQARMGDLKKQLKKLREGMLI